MGCTVARPHYGKWGIRVVERVFAGLQRDLQCFYKGLHRAVLGGSWVVISGVISPGIWVVSIVTLLLPPHITTHEPPSMGLGIPVTGQHPWKREGFYQRVHRVLLGSFSKP